jgi:hypothetical protein
MALMHTGHADKTPKTHTPHQHRDMSNQKRFQVLMVVSMKMTFFSGQHDDGGSIHL